MADGRWSFERDGWFLRVSASEPLLRSEARSKAPHKQFRVTRDPSGDSCRRYRSVRA